MSRVYLAMFLAGPLNVSGALARGGSRASHHIVLGVMREMAAKVWSDRMAPTQNAAALPSTVMNLRRLISLTSGRGAKPTTSS
jgi:hypothetical protein